MNNLWFLGDSRTQANQFPKHDIALLGFHPLTAQIAGLQIINIGELHKYIMSANTETEDVFRGFHRQGVELQYELTSVGWSGLNKCRKRGVTPVPLDFQMIHVYPCGFNTDGQSTSKCTSSHKSEYWSKLVLILFPSLHSFKIKEHHRHQSYCMWKELYLWYQTCAHDTII